jgi:hypothetical protein
MLATENRAIDPRKTGRRPNRSEIGPYINWAIPNINRFKLMVSFISSGVVPKKSVKYGRLGAYRSVDIMLPEPANTIIASTIENLCATGGWEGLSMINTNYY